MSEIGAILIVTAIAIVPISFAARCVAAIFSAATRERIAERPGTHIVWALAAGLAVTYFVVGFTLTRRKAEDHQRRMAEQAESTVPVKAAPGASSTAR